MPEPDCFLRYHISAATQNFITSGKSHICVLVASCCSEAWFLNGFIYREPSEHLCRRYMHSTECPSSLSCVDACLQADGEDELKKMQLLELAIMNGTYREALPPAGATFVINTPRTTMPPVSALLSAINIILSRQQWSPLNRFRTEQGHCGACRRKWRLTDTDLCLCGETKAMSHIVESCPLTKLNGGLSQLHSADEDAVLWLTCYGS